MTACEKPLVALDASPVLWAREGLHPALEDCVYEPVTARAVRARQWKAMQEAAEVGADEPRITEMSVWPLVVRAARRRCS